jgi:hypothetical protein
MTNTTYLVRFTSVNRRDEVATSQKSFKTDAARTAFLDKLEERGTLVEVLAYSDPS